MNPLEIVIKWYRDTVDSYGTVETGANAGFPFEGFYGVSISELSDQLLLDWNTLEDLTLVALTAAFEAFVLKEIKARLKSALGTPTGSDTYLENLYKYSIQRTTERTRFKVDVLPLFKSKVTIDTLTETAQVIEYRHWVAHGKAWPLSTPIASAEDAYEILTDFLRDAGFM